ncbi:hypothetical protein [Streptomyces sp. NPDC059788]|uniref:hypothetical protein n=1 Tax=Streptomyces sp. NPDC059788 TaxID=3346948 RepID=UPI003669FC13
MKPPALYAPDHIRGITIKQPWVTAILHGGKRVENRPRSWAPGWRLLHAAAQTDRAAVRDPLVARTIGGRELPTRGVLGIVRITGCHTDTGEPCSPWAQPDRIHVGLDDVHVLPLPIPCGGQLGPWRVPLPVFEQILVQLPDLAPRLTEAPS